MGDEKIQRDMSEKRKDRGGETEEAKIQGKASG